MIYSFGNKINYRLVLINFTLIRTRKSLHCHENIETYTKNKFEIENKAIYRNDCLVLILAYILFLIN